MPWHHPQTLCLAALWTEGTLIVSTTVPGESNVQEDSASPLDLTQVWECVYVLVVCVRTNVLAVEFLAERVVGIHTLSWINAETWKQCKHICPCCHN